MDKSTWSRNNNVRDLRELFGLLHHINSTNYNWNPEIHVAAREYFKLFHNLEGKFSRRRKDESEYSIGVISQLLQYGKCEACGFSATSLGASD